MNLSIFIARRYLFSKKKQNAINIISIISMVGVAIGTTALIVVLSVFNGIDTLLTEATDSFTPDLTISTAKGKFITTDTILIDKLARMPEISSCDPVVEENSLVKFGDKLIPVVVKGVDSTYAEHVNILPSIVSGIYSLEKDDKPAVVMGYGIKNQTRNALSRYILLPRSKSVFRIKLCTKQPENIPARDILRTARY